MTSTGVDATVAVLLVGDLAMMAVVPQTETIAVMTAAL